MSDTIAESAAELAAIKARIEKIAAERVALGKPAFLSAVGLELKDDLLRLKVLSGLPLTEFMRREFSQKYDIVEARPSTFAIVPKGQAFVPLAHEPRPKREPKGTIYKDDIWIAFSTPLLEGERYYNADTKSVDYGRDVPAGSIRIDPDLIRKNDEIFHARSIRDRVNQWIEANGLNPSDFIEEKSTERENKSDKLSVLDVLISSLDKKQLQSFSLPMDVVATLRGTNA